MKKLLFLLLSLPFVGLAQTPCDTSFAINANSQSSVEVVYSVTGPNLNMNSNFSWVYFNMTGQCIGGSTSTTSHIDTLNPLNVNNITDSTAIMCIISDSTSSCIVTDTLVYDSLAGWFFISNYFTSILTYVPDDNFEAYLEANGMGNGIANDDSVITANINAVTSLDIQSLLISDLTGIEEFILLDSLICSLNSITALDLSQNTQLSYLNCANNDLISLTINDNLNVLMCSYNNLTSIDVANALSLEYLWCNHNQLTTLNVSSNLMLIDLRCWENELINLDVSNNTQLAYLDTDYNQLTSLDVSNNPSLSALWCDNNNLISLNVANGNNHNFSFVPLFGNSFYQYTGFCAINNPNLLCITVDDPSWALTNWTSFNSSIDISANFSNDCSLEIAGCTDSLASNFNSSATILDGSCVISGKTFVPDSIFELRLENTGMGDGIAGNDSVYTQSIRYIQSLIIPSNYIIYDYTGIEDFWNLKALTLNQSTSTATISPIIDLSSNEKLLSLDLRGPHFDYLPDLSYNIYLSDIFIHNTGIVNCDLSDVLNLYEAKFLDNDSLVNLNLNNNTNLERLSISSNPLLSNVDLSSNTFLRTLSCTYNNQLTSLDVSSNLALTRLNCHSNQLTTLDVSLNTSLEYLNCSSNQLTTLDVSNNTNLETLGCSANQLSNIDLRNGNNIYQEVSIYNGIIYDRHLNLNATLNSQLYCISADDPLVADSIWPVGVDIDYNTSFSNDCASEIYGCTDTLAVNFNPSATLNAYCNYIDSLIYIPDDNFEQHLIGLGLDSILDDSVQYYKIHNIVNLYLTNSSIADLTGIGGFSALEFLDCRSNNLTSLDVSFNTALIDLRCYSNNLTSLDVSNNPALTYLNCYSNNLTSLDVSNNPALTNLYCSNNSLTSLDVSNNPALTYLDCNNNSLTSLDVSSNTALTDLRCYSNNLTSLDVSNNTALYSLQCQLNQLTSLDVNNNSVLNYLNCSNNPLTSLDVSNNTALTYLNCHFNSLSILDVTQNTWLTRLYCSSNGLTSLNVTQNTSLTTLHCYSNNLTSLDVSFNTLLYSLNCWNNQLTSLDVSGATNLNDFNCSHNQLTSLNVSQNANLAILECNSNNITSLDLSQNIILSSVNCADNQLTTLDLRNGNNSNVVLWYNAHRFINNPQLYCIDVDNVAYSNLNWTVNNGVIDSTMSFSTNCATAFGCTDPLACNYDSIATIEDNSCLFSSSSNASALECDSYTWNGVTYTSSGNYSATFLNSVGCDSVANLDLTINNSSSLTTSLTACDSYHWDGTLYSTSGTYTNTYTNVLGCDSLHTLNLTIKEKPLASIYNNSNNLTIIPSSGLAPYSYLWNTGEINQTITLTSFGTYWAYVTGNNGCSSDTAFYNHSISNIDNFVSDKKLLKIINQLGQNTPFRKNKPLYYLYDDGTVEKKIIIE